MSSNLEKPKVTIITVCYNAATELELTITSVLSQAFKSMEYIIIDGDSQDGTLDLINKYKEGINFFVSEKDHGVYDAMNKGIECAHGEWVIFMNAGDSFYDNHVLSKIFSRTYEESVGVIYGDVNLVFPNCGNVIKRFDSIKGKDQPLSICHQATVTRGCLLKENRFNLSYKITADAHLFYSLWKKGVQFEYVPICMANFESVAGLSSTKYIQAFEERSKIVGETWYNSPHWWIGYAKAVAKTALRRIQPRVEYEKRYFERIAKKYNPGS